MPHLPEILLMKLIDVKSQLIFFKDLHSRMNVQARVFLGLCILIQRCGGDVIYLLASSTTAKILLDAFFCGVVGRSAVLLYANANKAGLMPLYCTFLFVCLFYCTFLSIAVFFLELMIQFKRRQSLCCENVLFSSDFESTAFFPDVVASPFGG